MLGMRYVIFVIDTTSGSADGDEMVAIDAFNERLQSDGHWVMAAGIGAPSTATLIDNRNNLGSTAGQSLFSNPDYYSGFWIIEADSPDLARELALAGSKACNRLVELRPFLR